MKISLLSHFALAIVLTIGLVAIPSVSQAVDGVVIITQAQANTKGFPVIINQPGSYQLASNLTVPDENTDAIKIAADNVTLNLNGFSILGPNTCSRQNLAVQCNKNGNGVGVRSDPDPFNYPFSRNGLTIINGAIRGMGGSAIIGGDNLHVENLTINSNGGDGISQTISYGNAIITRNTISVNRGDGIAAPFGGSITNNTVSFNGDNNTRAGIIVTFANLIGNTVQGNAGFGLFVINNTTTTGYVNNVFVGNHGLGGDGQVSGGTQLGGNLCNGALCP